MKTELAVGNFRVPFESRSSRRRFVALFYAVLALWVLATLFLNREESIGAWIVAGGGTLIIALLLFFWSVAGDMNARGDEREMHRRKHAYFRAYHILAYSLLAAFLASLLFWGPKAITPSVPLALRAFLMQLPFALLIATIFLYVSLPPAILLWTEPDKEPTQE